MQRETYEDLRVIRPFAEEIVGNIAYLRADTLAWISTALGEADIDVSQSERYQFADTAVCDRSSRRAGRIVLEHAMARKHLYDKALAAYPSTHARSSES